MAHDVFLSYATPDKLTADAACAILERRGIRVWIAPRDVVPGSDWAESIVDAIESSRVMVVVFSSHANKSTQINREVERAAHHGIPLLPVRIEDALPSKSLEYFISARHWLDALTPPLERHLDRLAETIHRLLDSNDGKTGVDAPVTTPLAARAAAPTTPSNAKSSRDRRRWKSAIPAASLLTGVALVTWYQLTPHARDLAGKTTVAGSPGEDAPLDGVPVRSADALSGAKQKSAAGKTASDNTVPQSLSAADLDRRTHQALRDAGAAIMRSPDDATAYLVRSQAYLRLRQAKEAVADATRAIELQPNAAEGYLARSEAYLQLGKTKEAVVDASAAIDLNPRDAHIYLLRSNAHLQSGETKRAIEDATQAIVLDRDDIDGYLARCRAYLQNGDAERAVDDADEAIRIDPRSKAAFLLRSQAYLQLGTAK